MRKNVIITGCAKGIGREIALEFARFNYNIIGTYNTSLEDIKTLKTKIEAIGVKFDYYKLDLLDDSSIDSFCKIVTQNYEHIDVLINNAALSLDNDFYSKTKEEFMKVLEVNLIGPFLLIQKLVSLMDGGTIVNISSTDGINTCSRYNMDYSASKAGLINLTKSLALELENIKVYSISPNWVNTDSVREMNKDYLEEEMRRIGQKKLIEPIEVARDIVALVGSSVKTGSNIVMEDSHE